MVQKQPPTQSSRNPVNKTISNAFQWSAERAKVRDKLLDWARRQAQRRAAELRFLEWELSFTPTVMGHLAKMPVPVDARLATALAQWHKQRVVTGLALLLPPPFILSPTPPIDTLNRYACHLMIVTALRAQTVVDLLPRFEKDSPTEVAETFVGVIQNKL